MSIAVRDKVKEVIEVLDRADFQTQLRQALPAGLSVERFTRTTKVAIQMNPDVLDADRPSLFRSIVRCAQDGLLPDGREAALVTFKVKGVDTIQYLPMIGGFRKKAAEHGFAIEAHAVYAADTFEYVLGFEPGLVHVPPSLEQERGELIGAYAIGSGPDGHKYLEVMSRAEIEQVRAVSRAAKSEYGPWVKWPAEMYRKTVARRLFKQLPLADLDERARRMVEASDAEIELASAPVPELAGLAPTTLDYETPLDSEPDFDPEEPG